jgi:hypothetical protein
MANNADTEFLSRAERGRDFGNLCAMVFNGLDRDYVNIELIDIG